MRFLQKRRMHLSKAMDELLNEPKRLVKIIRNKDSRGFGVSVSLLF